MDIFRGDIVYVNLNPTEGSETGKIRPCLVIQNNVLNSASPTTIILVITSRDRFKKKYPSHVWINKGESGFTQIRTIDKSRIINKIGSIDNSYLKKVEEAIKITLSFEKYFRL
jgi:mRNA interferase MazF